MRTLLLSFASLALLAGCTAGHAAPSRAGSLTGTQWLRTDDTNAAPHVPTIEFTERRASGFDGCNTWFATPARKGDELHFGGVATTRRACEGDSTRAAERNFLNVLHSVRRATVENGELVFYNGSGAQIARFMSAEATAAAAAVTPEAPAAAPAPATTTPSN